MADGQMAIYTQLLLYNSENRFVGSFYQFTCSVERAKGFFEKSVFWDRLVGGQQLTPVWKDSKNYPNLQVHASLTAVVKHVALTNHIFYTSCDIVFISGSLCERVCAAS